MSHTCTAPCFPKCTSQATIILKNLNKSFLGYNCESHVPKNTAKDYVIEPLEIPVVK
jgi:hypothetical protein